MQEIIGWTGALLYIIAYFLVSIKIIQGDYLTFQLLNISGGICLIVNSLHQSDYPSVFTNGVWAAIGFLLFITTRESESKFLPIVSYFARCLSLAIPF